MKNESSLVAEAYDTTHATITDDFVNKTLTWNNRHKPGPFKYLASGGFRSVWAADNEIVIKISSTDGFGGNTPEAEAWDKIKNLPVARFFAPVRAVSSSGRWLIMDRGEPFKGTWDEFNDWRKTLPMFLQQMYDLKPNNVAVFGDEIKIIDYGFGLDAHGNYGLSYDELKAAV